MKSHAPILYGKIGLVGSCTLCLTEECLAKLWARSLARFLSMVGDQSSALICWASKAHTSKYQSQVGTPLWPMVYIVRWLGEFCMIPTIWRSGLRNICALVWGHCSLGDRDISVLEVAMSSCPATSVTSIYFEDVTLTDTVKWLVKPVLAISGRYGAQILCVPIWHVVDDGRYPNVY